MMICVVPRKDIIRQAQKTLMITGLLYVADLLDNKDVNFWKKWRGLYWS